MVFGDENAGMANTDKNKNKKGRSGRREKNRLKKKSIFLVAVLER
jgi:hypothetical protein